MSFNLSTLNLRRACVECNCGHYYSSTVALAVLFAISVVVIIILLVLLLLRPSADKCSSTFHYISQ